jgi:putative membrane protein
VLQRTGIIGWNVQQSWFQRRAGLVTLVATTAAGQQAYAAFDLPEAEAIALADAAVPGLVRPFLA